MKFQLRFHTLLEFQTLLHCQRVSLCNNRHKVYVLTQVFHGLDVQRFQLFRSSQEIQTHVNATVLDVSFAVDRGLFFVVRMVLFLDELDNMFPTPIVVELIPKPGTVNNCQQKVNPILRHLVRSSLDFGGFAWSLARLGCSLRLQNL
eukprot:Lithocolla_globosa_v1_NODE_6321_length_1104_cov_530.849380.p2 type:complete len:147 gc:universal NODE_6321_length_1104_cov_530.849380:404-844(+)